MDDDKASGLGGRADVVAWTIGGLMFCGVATTLQVLFKLEPGSTADWVAAIATTAALAAAVHAGRAAWHQLRIQQESARAQAAAQDAAQAQLVAGWVPELKIGRDVTTKKLIGISGIVIALRNASELPVYEVSGWVRDRQTQGETAKAPFSVEVLDPTPAPVHHLLTMPEGTLIPVESFGEVEESKLPSQFQVEMSFRDSAGRWWIRSGTGALSRHDSA